MSHARTLVANYIKLLGADRDYPTAFDPKYEPQYETFKESFSVAETADRKKLFIALEFMRYMHGLGIGVLSKQLTLVKTREVTSTRFSPQTVYEQLVVAGLRDRADLILALLRKTHVLTHLKVASSKVSLNSISDLKLVHHIELSSDRERLDDVLRRLQGSLYSQQQIPMQLAEQYTKVPPASKLKSKIITKSAKQLMADSSSFAWLPLKKSDEFSVYAVRAAKDRLLIRIVMPVEQITKGINTVKRTIPKYWALIFKEYS